MTDLEAQVGELLKQRQMSLSAAESCTGGLISSRITDVSGSSTYFLGGAVVYSNEAKMRLLGVQEKTLIDFGAVSEETAAEMAQGAMSLFQTDLALAVTGIAGPLGGTEEKPVGLTYIALSSPQGIQVKKFIWLGDRIANKISSAEAALMMVIEYFEGQEDHATM